MYHWTETNSGYLLFYNDYTNNLPITGWIHMCVNCFTKTSKIYPYYKHFDSNDLPINVIICKDCCQTNRIPHKIINNEIKNYYKY